MSATGGCTASFALWPQVIGEIRVSHLTPFLCLLLALAWRYRDVASFPASPLGSPAAVKFFLWPLGIWLAAIGRAREALIAAGVAAASLLLVLPFTGLHDYSEVLLQLGRTFDKDSYSPFGLLSQLDVAEALARVATSPSACCCSSAAGGARASASRLPQPLVLSPIVWLDYYAVAAIPLAIVRPRLSAVWFAPLATWGLLNAGIGAATVWGGLRVLVAFAVVILVTVRAESRAPTQGEDGRAATAGGLAAASRIDPKPKPSSG